MNRYTRLLIFALASLVVCTTACRDSISGTLWVAEPLALKGSSSIHELSPGQYPVRVVASNRGVKLEIERRPGDTITTRINTAGAQSTPNDGTARISSGESGQPFDLEYDLTTTGGESTSSSALPCTRETTQVRCVTRTRVIDAQTGETTTYEDCSREQVLVSGQLAQSTSAKSTTTLNGRMIDPRSGRTLAALSAYSRRAGNSTESLCR